MGFVFTQRTNAQGRDEFCPSFGQDRLHIRTFFPDLSDQIERFISGYSAADNQKY